MTDPFAAIGPVFPNNAIDLIVTRLGALYPTLTIKKRPLKHTDGPYAVGMFASDWFPDDNSIEMQSREPTVQNYLVTIQGFVKSLTEEDGIASHSVMSKVVRSMLYTDNPLKVGLDALSVTMNGSTERIQRRKVGRQRYLSNEISGEFLYLSSIEYRIETETK